MANTLVKLNVSTFDGAVIPQGTSPLNFQEQLFNKGRFSAVTENADGGSIVMYQQYAYTGNKIVKVYVSEDYADILAALETDYGKEKAEVDVLAINGVPVVRKQIISIEQVIRITKDPEDTTQSLIFYEDLQAQSPSVIKVSQDIEELSVITQEGYYSGGVAAEIL